MYPKRDMMYQVVEGRIQNGEAMYQDVLGCNRIPSNVRDFYNLEKSKNIM